MLRSTAYCRLIKERIIPISTRYPHLARIPDEYLDVRRPILNSQSFDLLELAGQLGENYAIARPSQPCVSVLPLLTTPQLASLNQPDSIAHLRKEISAQQGVFPSRRALNSSSLRISPKGICNTSNGGLFFAEAPDLVNESKVLARAIEGKGEPEPCAQIFIARIAFVGVSYNSVNVARVRDVIQGGVEAMDTTLELGPLEVYTPPQTPEQLLRAIPRRSWSAPNGEEL